MMVIVIEMIVSMVTVIMLINGSDDDADSDISRINWIDDDSDGNSRTSDSDSDVKRLQSKQPIETIT